MDQSMRKKGSNRKENGNKKEACFRKEQITGASGIVKKSDAERKADTEKRNGVRKNADADGWYVIQVVGGQEHIVKNLISKCFSEKRYQTEALIEECFIPMRERKVKYQGAWRLVQERVLPGYVFIVTTKPETVFYELKQVPRFTSLLGKSDMGFIPLNEQEVHFLSRFGDRDHVSHLSQVMVEKGNKIRILEGDLKNFEGEIVKINLHKRIAIVRVPFMGSSVDVHLGIEIVERVAMDG